MTADLLTITATPDVVSTFLKQKTEFHFDERSDNEFIMFLLDTAVRVISIVQHLAPVIEAVSDANVDKEDRNLIPMNALIRVNENSVSPQHYQPPTPREAPTLLPPDPALKPDKQISPEPENDPVYNIIQSFATPDTPPSNPTDLIPKTEPGEQDNTEISEPLALNSLSENEMSQILSSIDPSSTDNISQILSSIYDGNKMSSAFTPSMVTMKSVMNTPHQNKRRKLEPGVVQQELPKSVCYINSKGNCKQLVIDGYRHSRNKTRNTRTYWICVDKAKYGCHGTAITDGEILLSYKGHQHVLGPVSYFEGTKPPEGGKVPEPEKTPVEQDMIRDQHITLGTPDMPSLR